MNKINIKESLIKIDRETNFRHTLTDLYEACMLNEDKQQKLVQYIADRDIPGMSAMLSNEAGVMAENVSDDIPDDEMPEELKQEGCKSNLDEDFEEGDMVHVKPSKKSGRILSKRGDLFEVELQDGKDPDRIDTFYSSDLEPSDSNTLEEKVDFNNLQTALQFAAEEKLREMGYDGDFISDYFGIKLENTEDDQVKVSVYGELDYDEMSAVADVLNHIVSEEDPKAYFDHETSGRIVSYIRNDQSDDIVDEEQLNKWSTKFNNCKTLEELKDVYSEFINIMDELTGGTIDALYDIIDKKDDELERNDIIEEDMDESSIEYLNNRKCPECGEELDKYGQCYNKDCKRGNFTFDDDDLDESLLNEGPFAVLGDLAGKGVGDAWKGVKNFARNVKDTGKDVIKTAKEVKDGIKQSKQAAKVRDFGRAIKNANNVDEFKADYKRRQDARAASDKKRDTYYKGKKGSSIGDKQDWKFEVNGKKLSYDQFMAIPQAERQKLVKEKKVKVFDLLGRQTTFKDHNDRLKEMLLRESYDPRRSPVKIWKDTSGIMGIPEETYTINDLLDYWNENKDSDLVLTEYEGNREEWLDDTLSQMEEQIHEAIEMTADEMKAKYGTDNPDIINAGTPEEERVILKESDEAKKEVKLRKKIYNEVMQRLYDSLDNLAQEIASKIPEYDPEWCAEDNTKYEKFQNSFAIAITDTLLDSME